MRPQCNRLLILAALIVLLPAVTVGERLRRGWGRRIAVAGVRCLVRACGVRLEIRGREHIPSSGPWLIAANHQSPADIAALVVAAPEAGFLAAAELFPRPLLGSTMRALGCVPIDRANPRAAYAELARLPLERPDFRLAVFPEGGFARHGTRRPFKSGAFGPAIAVGATVLPVAIAGAGDVLPADAGFLVRPGRVRVEFLAPIAASAEAGRSGVRDQAEAAVLGALAAMGEDWPTVPHLPSPALASC